MTRYNLHATALTILILCTVSTNGIAQSEDWAIRFDGGSLDFPHNPIMLPTYAMTKEVWIRSNPGTTGSLVCFQRTHTGGLWGITEKDLVIHPNGSIVVRYPCCNAATPPGAVPVGDGLWHHVAFVRYATAGAQRAIYVDGQPAPLVPSPFHCEGSTAYCHLQTSYLPTVFKGTTGGAGWELRAARRSTVERYAYNNSFTPAESWATDASTTMLLPLAVGVGPITYGGSIYAQNGSLTGQTEWVPIFPPCPAGICLDLTQGATIGEPLQVRLQTNSPDSATFVFADPFLGSTPLGPQGIWGNTQLAFSSALFSLSDVTNTFNPGFTVPYTNSEGHWFFGTLVPNWPALVGITLHLEAYVIDVFPPLPPNGFFWQSNVLSLTIQ